MSTHLLPVSPAVAAARPTVTAPATPPPRRRVSRFLAPLDRLAENSRWLLSRSFGRFTSEGQECTATRYLQAIAQNI